MKSHEEVRPPEMDWPLLRARIAELEAEVARLQEMRRRSVDAYVADRARVAELEAELEAARANVVGMNAARETEAYRTAVLAMREACENLDVQPTHQQSGERRAGWLDALVAYRAAIRARPAP